MKQTTTKTLYEKDFALWVEDTLSKLKAKDYSQVDWENLLDEVESLAKRDRRELENRLTTLFEHALKRYYVQLPDCYRGWETTIKRTQKELRKILRDSPSLKSYLLMMIDQCYQDAVDNLVDEYEVNFPDCCPFPVDVEELLGQRFWRR